MPFNSRLQMIDQKGKHSVRGGVHIHVATLFGMEWKGLKKKGQRSIHMSQVCKMQLRVWKGGGGSGAQFEMTFGTDLTKNPWKGGMGKLLNSRADHKKRWDSVGKGGCSQSGYFSCWGVANVTTVTFHYILVIVFLFALIVGVRSCFHFVVLVAVYRVYTSCFHNTVFSSCYRLHTSYLHHAGGTSCFSLNVWF